MSHIGVWIQWRIVVVEIMIRVEERRRLIGMIFVNRRKCRRRRKMRIVRVIKVIVVVVMIRVIRSEGR